MRTVPSCVKDDNLVHYLQIHYCAMGEAAALSGCCQLALIALFFYVLATVAERFFCPALENVAAALRLPEDVAGATLLSFGNGAPDVFAQIAALSQALGNGTLITGVDQADKTWHTPGSGCPPVPAAPPAPE